jgi:hypothetical protein
MRSRLACLLAVAILGVGGLGVTGAAQARSLTSATTAKACSKGYVSANLPWGHKCLRAGEFCKKHNKAYRKYGFVCPSSGHLRRR